MRKATSCCASSCCDWTKALSADESRKLTSDRSTITRVTPPWTESIALDTSGAVAISISPTIATTTASSTRVDLSSKGVSVMVGGRLERQRQRRPRYHGVDGVADA